MSTSTKLSEQSKLDEILSAVNKGKTAANVNTKTTQATKTITAAQIQENVFQQIVTSNATPKQKVAYMQEQLEAVQTKEESRAITAALEEFKAFMQQERREWSMESLNLASTEVLSELQGVYREMNDGMNNVNAELMPQIEMLQALSDLRLQGKTQDAYLEVQKDTEELERRAKVRAEQEQQANDLIAAKEAQQRELAQLSQKTRFLIGGHSTETKQAMALLELDIQKTDQSIADLVTKRQETEAEFSQPMASALGDDPKIQAAKKQLSDLMNTPEKELNDKQQRLKDAVMTYINSIDAKTKLALGTLNKQSDQCVRSMDQANAMRNIYAIINDATKAANTTNQKRFDDVNSQLVGAESETDKMELEEKKSFLTDHISVLMQTGGETLTTLGELTEEQMRVRSMQDANRQEIQKVNRLHNSGNAGMASRLLTVFNGVNQAASHEASAMVENSIGSMRESTTDLMHRGILANAMGLGEENERRLKQIMEMDQSSQVLTAAFEETKANLSALQETDNALALAAEKLRQENIDLAAAWANQNGQNEAAATTPGAPVAPSVPKANRFDAPKV